MRNAAVESAHSAATPVISSITLQRRRAQKKIAVFLLLVAVLAGVVDVLRLLVPFGTQLFILTWTPRLADALVMCSVGLAGIIALVAIDRSLRDLGLNPGPTRYLFLASALPFIFGAVVYVPVWIFELGRFAGTASLWFAVQSALVHFPLHLFAAAGEEVGWRGVLVPNLARTVGSKGVAFLPGAIWALWHYPDILFFDYNAGTSLIFALTCFSISLMGAGALLSWLRLRSGSIWPAVMFHGVHNSVMLGVFDRVTEPKAVTPYITGEFGAGLSVLGILIGYAFWSKLDTYLKHH